MSEEITPEKILVDKKQLQDLVAQNKELKQMTVRTISVMLSIVDMMGGTLPKSTPEMIVTVSRLIKKFASNTDAGGKLFDEIKVLLSLAPNYMTDEQKARFEAINSSLNS